MLNPDKYVKEQPEEGKVINENETGEENQQEVQPQ
jgi:hypothetical protein